MMMKKMCGVHKVAWALLLVGGVNWMLVGLFGRDLFVLLGLGMGSVLARAVYVLVGLAALSMLGLGKCCMKGGCCGGGDKEKMQSMNCSCGSDKKPEDCCKKGPEAPKQA